MRTFKDTDIREALQRKFADTPQVPSDLNERLQNRLTASLQPSPKERESSRSKSPLLWRGWGRLAAAAVLVAVVALFTWKSQTPQTPMKPGETIASHIEMKDTLGDTLNRRTRESVTPHAGIANAARGNGQRRTRRFGTPQPTRENEAAAKAQDTQIEEPLLAEAEPMTEAPAKDN